ncbi:tripartite tricarboxylate transporter substrate binding protein [Reyranella sp.]|uniref:tripartite tricarboxylate transporter substrate binding protein n=1 Tax=Reyranella sp. TaxID=1929291 RepID=UPI0025D82FE3|nr:tripartite tricarboxylate transporter substrate binding protein [Reyranella sp.]
MGETAGPKLGQPIIVEAKPGAAGTLAPAMLLNARPDGHQLACMSINSLRYPHYQPTNWNPIRDFTYIIGLSGYTIGIVVRADAPWQTLEELVAAAKKEPDKYNYATSGIGGTGQLTMIEVEQTTGAKFTHVPYKGTAEWTQALLGGEVHFICDGAQWAPMVDAAKFRILAMATEQRIAKYKDVPTLKERGIDVVGQSPYGLVGPKDLPPNIVESVHQAFKAAMADPRVDALLDSYIQAPWYKSPGEYRAYAERYFVEVKPLLIKAGLARSLSAGRKVSCPKSSFVAVSLAPCWVPPCLRHLQSCAARPSGSPRSRSRSTIRSPRAASPTCMSGCSANRSARLSASR